MRITAFLSAVLFFNAFAFNSSQAKASEVFISASYLYEVCARDENGKEKVSGGHTACQAYIAGVIDYHNLLESLGTAPSVDVCVPNTVKPSDLQDVVWDYLDINTQHDAFAAAPAITLALSDVFPCKKRGR